MSTSFGAEESSQSQWLAEFLKSGAVTLALTKDQAATQLQVKRTKLDELIAMGLIRVVYYEPNGHPRILLSELVRFLEERMEHARATAASSPPPPLKKSRKVRAGSAAEADLEVEKLKELRRKRRRER